MDCATNVDDDDDDDDVDDVGGGGNSVSISKIKLAFDGTDVVTDGIVVVTVELTQAVEDVCNVAAPIPKTSNGTAATIATRPVEARTQRATANPMTSNTNAARAKPTVPPVAGNLHSSTAIMIHPACNQHHYGNKAIASKTVTDGNDQQLIWRLTFSPHPKELGVARNPMTRSLTSVASGLVGQASAESSRQLLGH